MCLSYLTVPDPLTGEVADKRPANEQIMEIEEDSSNPGRIEVVSTTDTQVPPYYIYWKTVRLRHVEGKNKEGVPSEEVDAVMVWRRKCAIFFTEKIVLTILSFAAAAAAADPTRNDGSAHVFHLGLNRWVHTNPPLPTISFYLAEFTKSL